MRTTLTVDDLIMRELKEKAHQTGKPLKQVINATLEVGLRNLEKQHHQQTFTQKTFSLGFQPTFDINKALQATTMLDDDETIRKIEIRKNLSIPAQCR